MASDGTTQHTAAPAGGEEEQRAQLSTYQQPGNPQELNASTNPVSGYTPQSEATPKDHLTVISEATETSNGVCSVVDSAPVSLSPGTHAKGAGHHHGNGRVRLGSRSSVSYAGSPRPSLQPGAGPEGIADGNKPNDYLLWAILACLCPVWPINIVGLTFSVMSRNSLQQGNVDGARRLGRNAKILSIVSFIGGIIIIATAIAVNLGVSITHSFVCVCVCLYMCV
ncbi:hypothetical protein ACEWY4_026483 [Coilia grayii]|uniref:Proline-rich transmembrane protein 2 n=1 Tax=Coilia grayii TaxID=363190 RepID=A0ABD1IYX3_9TELE